MQVAEVKQGDCLDLLRDVPADSVDLIATDPPYFMERDFQADGGTFTDRWESLPAFVGHMRERAEELRRVLKPGGTLYWQCEPRAGAYLRVMLDEVLGLARHVTTIIWRRSDGQNGARSYTNQVDFIFMYGQRVVRREVARAPDAQVGHQYEDERGVHSRHALVTRLHQVGEGKDPERLVPWRGVDVQALGYRWRWPKRLPKRFKEPAGFAGWPLHARLDELDRQGFVYWSTRLGLPYMKVYDEDRVGNIPGNLWDDIGRLTNTSSERSGYPTQKPLALYDRMIRASSAPGDLVLDPFCGSGTTLVAAARAGRRALGFDIGEQAVKVARERLRTDEGELL